MADFASVTRLTQTGFNEGIQELNVYMDNDVAIPQQWKWPDCRKEGDAGSYSLHDVYVRLFEAGMEPDELYLFVTVAAQQVGGKTLSQASPQPAAENPDDGEEVGEETGDAGGDETETTEETAEETGEEEQEEEESEESEEEEPGEEEEEEEKE